NSYYKSAGKHIEQACREFIHPELKDVLQYRNHIDQEMTKKILTLNQEEKKLLRVGLEHEQQHQELILMDVLRTYFLEDKDLVYSSSLEEKNTSREKLSFQEFLGGLVFIGTDFDKEEFCYDNETPRNQVYIAPFKLASRLV